MKKVGKEGQTARRGLASGVPGDLSPGNETPPTGKPKPKPKTKKDSAVQSGRRNSV
jgi:hypothetical protein